MITSQLRKALLLHPKTTIVYGGVYARNRIPTIPPHKKIAFIVNTDPSHKPGEHWVGFYLTKSTVYYFDPYGIPPVGFQKILQSRNKTLYFGKR